MPICIAGMHRSGTSMVTRLLHGCGLHLGPPEAMIPPAPDNPEGFWEHRGFLTLNDEVLAALAGSWAEPPLALADAWLDAPAILAHRARAQAMLDDLHFPEPWGWKDPRNALTIGFWRALLPGLRVVVCVRHPAAVVESMRTRGAHAAERSAWLYRSYHENLLAAVPAADRVVTHYEAYFVDPARELARLCAALGLTPTPAMVDAAVATIHRDLNHHATATPAPVPAGVLQFYAARLCDGGDPSTAPPPSSHRESLLRSHVLTLGARLDERIAQCDDLTATVATRTAERDGTAALLADAEEAIAARDDVIAGLQQRLAAERTEVRRLDTALDALHVEAEALRADGTRVRSQLAALTQGRAWGLLERAWALRLRLVPRGSRRERLLGLAPRRAPSG